jgi:hypothetical protein
LKKKINIALILVVLALWGTVAYRTIHNCFFSKKIIVESESVTNEMNLSQVNKDTFLLEKIQRDPFLNTETQSPVAVLNTIAQNSVVVRKPTTNKPIPKPKEVIIWPEIAYYGYIKDGNGQIALIKVNAKLYRLKKYQQVESLIIKTIYNDSIELELNKEKRIISLNKKE